jgi:pseudouridylate synthase
MPRVLTLHSEVQAALQNDLPVVALESTLIAHGLPWPVNLETARRAEAAVRETGAVPATIAVLGGTPTIGLNGPEMERLARSKEIRKASRRDLAAAIIQGADAATTVAATMVLAHRAGIAVFATGGIGGVHPGGPWDVSADLVELARTPVLVVCAGAKSILDLPATLEVLETQAVPVVGYQTDTFPAFYLTSSGLPVSARVNSPREAAHLAERHWSLGGAGIVLAQAVPESEALDPEAFRTALTGAEALAEQAGVRGPRLTPFLLRKLAELTNGRSLRVNESLIVANARLAGLVALERAKGHNDASAGNR